MEVNVTIGHDTAGTQLCTVKFTYKDAWGAGGQESASVDTKP